MIKPPHDASKGFNIAIDDIVSSDVTFRRVHNHQPMLKITTVEQNRLLRGTIRPVRVWIVQRRSRLSSRESLGGNSRHKAAEIVSGSRRHESTNAEQKWWGVGDGGSGGGGVGVMEYRRQWLLGGGERANKISSRHCRSRIAYRRTLEKVCELRSR